MAMYYTRLPLFITIFIFSFGFSQENFESLGESSIALNHKVNDFYNINFSARTRYYLYKGNNIDIKNRQMDLVHFSTYKLNYNNSISFGIQYRFREGFDGESNELRLTQQYNYTKQNSALRFGHRFRFEQRILDDITILRSRYRFAIDSPLNGEKLDIGESYLVASMEMLLSQNKHIKSEIGHRTTAQMGWLISEKLRLQMGLEYRFEAFNLKTEEKLFILSSAILKL